MPGEARPGQTLPSPLSALPVERSCHPERSRPEDGVPQSWGEIFMALSIDQFLFVSMCCFHNVIQLQIAHSGFPEGMPLGFFLKLQQSSTFLPTSSCCHFHW